MLFEDPNFLTPSGRKDEKILDALKRWLAGDTSTVEFEAATTTDVVMAAEAAVDHLSLDLLIHADSIVRQALTDERYGLLEIEGGQEMFRSGSRLDWESMQLEIPRRAKRVPLVSTMEAARDNVRWLRKQIRRLESLMERAGERKGMGYETALWFVADKRPANRPCRVSEL